MSNPKQPKKFGQTAGAQVDTGKAKMPPLSDLVGSEIRVYGWESATSSFGEYGILHIRRRGGEMEEVKTSSWSVLKQLRGMGDDDWPFEAWVCQSPAPEGMTGRLYFAAEPQTLKDAPLGGKGN
jgi:hypothetical protein